MKGFGLLCLVLLLTGMVSFMYHGYYSAAGKGSITSNYPGMVSMESGSMALMWKSRKLTNNNDRDKEGHVELEDYRPIDPVPSSKASVRPGPIQHGTPLMPYIPKPSPPPTQPKHGG
ncbi:hypothetical protein ABFS82_03G036300 [Erythranthe guttata]|nr:PREDICTED: uncharacterized protein LOC105971303 [Erythranthe guttata]|eukprot:XP_012851604.1 PREDICTED: uncharacterized protein LOC105971303 [Erythranthe guttata]